MHVTHLLVTHGATQLSCDTSQARVMHENSCSNTRDKRAQHAAMVAQVLCCCQEGSCTHQKVKDLPVCDSRGDVRALQRAAPAVLCMHPATQGQVQDEQLAGLWGDNMWQRQAAAVSMR
jgi:hypothetical protein